MKVEDWGDESSVTIGVIREDGERLMPKRFLKIFREGAGSLFQYFTPLYSGGGSYVEVLCRGAPLGRVEWEGEKQVWFHIIHLKCGNQVSPK